ncbi:uncharacterized protein LOC34620262 [Cyclospora cayetanensis]|uniref:Uncharacterized protein LOC34620262 n=1 Tax=Cyclospora cayetanensis TaxID=88456 RepID=A0A6P6RUD9_9EIME|nr:uncharacterized protein LOC34620262 [Cyclospora cayetanensis]
MSRYIHRALCAFAAAAIISPLSTCGHDAPVPHSAQPGVEQSPQMPNAGTVPYGHHYPHPPASDPSAAYPHPPSTHEPHGYGDPHHPLPPNNHENAASAPPPPQYALWEQSSGTTELLTHSWHPPLTAENLSQWDVAMATVPSGEHLVLLPGDANRTGQFWHRNAIPAMQFEVQFGFGVFGKDNQTQETAEAVAHHSDGQPEGFAFWYVYESYTSVYPRSPEEQTSWSLIGYKNNPKGLGVVFKSVDRDGRLNPSISCIHNTADGRELAKELPTSSAFFYQYRNKTAPVLFRVIVGDQGVVAQIRESVTSAWATACSLDHVRLHPHGFIGFTGHNRPAGQVPHAHQHPGDQVVLYFVKTWSMEPLAPTQHTATPQLAAYSSDEKHVATEADAHLPHNEQYGIYSDFSHPSSYAPPSHNNADQTVMGLLQSIGNQISMLSMEVDELRQDLRKHWGDEGPEAVKSLKSELTGFKDLFKRHSQQHSSALNTIHKHVETKASSAKDGDSSIISRLTDLSSQIEKDVTMRYANSFLLSMAALVLVILFALCSWRKFHDIEKKHML